MSRKLPQWILDLHCEEVLCYLPHKLKTLALVVVYENNLIKTTPFKVAPNEVAILTNCENLETEVLFRHIEYDITPRATETKLNNYSFFTDFFCNVESVYIDHIVGSCFRYDLKVPPKKRKADCVNAKRRGFSCKRRLFE